jgi:hypothetical protein
MEAGTTYGRIGTGAGDIILLYLDIVYNINVL